MIRKSSSNNSTSRLSNFGVPLSQEYTISYTNETTRTVTPSESQQIVEQNVSTVVPQQPTYRGQLLEKTWSNKTFNQKAIDTTIEVHSTALTT